MYAIYGDRGAPVQEKFEGLDFAAKAGQTLP
jgi:hypothetical protein